VSACPPINADSMLARAGSPIRAATLAMELPDATFDMAPSLAALGRSVSRRCFGIDRNMRTGWVARRTRVSYCHGAFAYDRRTNEAGGVASPLPVSRHRPTDAPCVP